MTQSMERGALDCATCREMKLADPRASDPAVLEHLRRCPPCALFSSRIDAFEERLCATAEVPVPDGLAERVLLRRPRGGRLRRWYERCLDALGGGGRSAWFGPALGGLTAGAALGIAVLVAYERRSEPDPLARSIIAHVLSEPEVLQQNDRVPRARVIDTLARYGGRLEGPLEVRFLGQCFIEGKMVDHLLVETPEGLATLILVQGEAISQEPHTENRFTAVILPLQDASLGIVTGPGASAAEVQRLMKQSIRVEG
jgi:hypothetical protein